MTPKKRLKFLVLALAGCFTVVAPALVEARDISLPKYSKDAQLAAFQTAAEIDPLSQFNDEDPLTEILSINEVDVWGRIRHGFAMPPSPRRGRLWCLQIQKTSPQKGAA